ncbi:MAG: F0F1 ATP synthase subunit gamma [Archangium sp.]|nr:F0F1 ATP synthase subunit gamma [Archangium sp.]MDP3155810.1 F0F1 ATP synthase subunit gamma [Archangium sp.]MDP3574184.1 F0F1 ATP synthase subunit gamma [Archangium sp.]
MSDTRANLRRKIASAGDLQSVVRTMKALAAASVGQYEKSVQALGDAERTVQLGLGACLRQGAAAPRAGPQRPQPGAFNAVVFGSDQGLVGQFNEVVVEHALEALSQLPGEARVWAVGARAYARLADAGLRLQERLVVPTSVKAISPLVGRILVDTEASEVVELHLFHNRPTSGGAYAPIGQRVLPLDDAWRAERAALPWPGKTLPEVLGGTETVLRGLIRESLFISLFRACAESLASENASRLAAMQRADKNIDELLEGLNRTFQRLRQSSIDEELFDVVSGFEALSKENSR